MCENFLFRATLPEDIEATIDLRGRTRDNPVPRERLEHLGSTGELDEHGDERLELDLA